MDQFRSARKVFVLFCVWLTKLTKNLLSNAVKFTDSGSVRLYCDVASSNGEEPSTPYFREWTHSMDSLHETASDTSSQDDRVLFNGTNEVDDSGHFPSGAIIPLRFRIIDTGIGCLAQDIDIMFSPFGQADVSTPRLYGGTGLGLAISSQLASLLGGQLTCSSGGPTPGSNFELRLPVIVGSRAELLHAESSSSSTPVVDKPRPIPHSSRPSTLVEPDAVQLGQTALSKQENTLELPEQEKISELPATFQQNIEPNARILLVDDNQVNLKVCDPSDYCDIYSFHLFPYAD